MLRFMRRHASRWVMWFIFGTIIVVFIFSFGFGRGGVDKSVATVGPYKISAVEYWDSYKKTENYYRMLYRDKFDEAARNELKLKETVMNSLVDKYLLLKKAEDMGLRVSDKEFADNLAKIDAFTRNGKFDRQAYLDFLRRNNLDPKTFEESERQSMTVGKLTSIIQDNGVAVDETAAYGNYLKERGQVKLSYGVFDPEDHKTKVTVDEKELSALYDKEKGAHRSENTYHLKFIVLDEKSGIKDDQAYMELLKSKDIGVYGKSHGLEVVDTGVVKESDLASRFARVNIQERLKGMGKGDISLPLRDDSRSYIFQIVDREEGKPLAKEEALKVIQARIARERAGLTARAKAEDAIREKDAKLPKDTGLLSRNATAIPGIGPIPKDTPVLALSKGQTYEKPVEIGGKFYVFAYLDEKQPDKEQWEKEKDGYKRYYTAVARNAYLTTFKEDMKKTVKIKVDWGEL